MSTSDHREFEGTQRFAIERCLGAGAFGTVYEAFDRERNTRLALKRLRQTDAAALYRFKREFRALADLAHPNLVSLYELLSDGEQWFFTMELLDGVDFLNYFRADPRRRSDIDSSSSPTASGYGIDSKLKTMDSPVFRAGHHQRGGDEIPPGPPLGSYALVRLRGTLRQLAEGLLALHEAGILHCDIKPSNVLVTGEGRVVLLDFGLVAELSAFESTQSTHIVGTPAYMSPEQGAGLHASEASDWYSMGVMLFEVLTGRLPFAATLEAFRDKQISEARAPLDLVPNLPEDLNALCRDLLRRDPAKRPHGREVLRRLGRDSIAAPKPISALLTSKISVPFVGREVQLASLHLAYQEMKRGRAVSVFVHGSSGMGKTALVRQFLERLQQIEKDAVILTGRCYERESVPYKALDSLIDHLSGYLKSLRTSTVATLLPRNVRALARVFPVLQRVEAVARARRSLLDIPDSRELRRRAFTGLRELLGRLSDRKPLVLFIDDLQWGDVDSAALLAELMRPPDPPALLLIGCYRSEEATTSPLLGRLLPLLGTSAWTPHIHELLVGELAPKEARDLALKLLGKERPTSAAHAETIARESAGSPFFINELVQYTHTGGGLGDRGDQVLFPAGLGTTAATLDEVIQTRVSRLPEESQRLLSVIAVAGRPVEVSLVKRAAKLRRENEALTLLRAGHLIRSRGAEARPEVEAYHDRIRVAVIASLSPEALRVCHHRLARTLEAEGDADPETLSVHFHAGGDLETAAEYAEAAALQASEALAFDRAARLYRLALDLHPPHSPTRHALQMNLGDALANAGHGPEAAEAYLGAAGDAKAAEKIELQRRAAEQFLISGRIDEGLRVARTVLGTIGMRLAETPRRALLSLLLRRAQLRLRGLRFREREATQVSPHMLFRIDTCWSVAEGLAVVDTIRGADIQTRHLLLALRAGEPYRISRALALEAAYCSTAGGRSRRRTEKLLQSSTRLSEQVEDTHAIGLVMAVSGTASYLGGRWRQTRELLREAEEILLGSRTGVAWELSNVRFFSIASLFWLGELKELSRCLPDVLKNAEERGDLLLATQLRAWAAHLMYLAADRPDVAREEGRHAIERWSHQGFHIQHYEETWAQVNIALYSGDSRAAWELVTERWPALKRSLLLRIQIILIPSLGMRAASALAAAAAGIQPRKLLRVAERDARHIEREKAAWGDPLAQLIRASVFAFRGEVAVAVALLASAEKGFQAVDMALYAAVSRRRRGELVGGEAGRVLVDEADDWMTGQEIRNPGRMTGLLAPGRWTES